MPEPPKLRVMFVDDEPAVLQVLQSSLGGMSQEWEVAFCERGDTALVMMEERPFDVVVSDMRMAAVSGAELINELLRRFPRTVRLVVSGYTDEELVMKCVAATHQYFAKPIELERLKGTLRRIACLGARLPQTDLRAAVSGVSRLPSAPAAHGRLVEALESPSCSIRQIGEVVACDPCLAAQLLKLVNSAFFGFTREVSDVVEAVQLLGVGTLRSLALTFQLFARFDPTTCATCSLESVWSHSRRTAVLARRIAQVESADGGTVEQAFTAGLLHNVGKLILAVNSPAQYTQVLSWARELPGGMAEAERRAWQTTSADVGAYLLGLWGLPVPLVDAAAHHRTPGKSADQAFTPLTAVHVASVLAREAGPPSLERILPLVDVGYLQRLKLADRLPDWVSAASA